MPSSEMGYHFFPRREKEKCSPKRDGIKSRQSRYIAVKRT